MPNSHATSTTLINGCQGLVRSIAWKIHQKVPRNVDLDDLIGFGQVGLAEAARDFDDQRGVQFTTYAYYRVRGAILDGLSSMSWFSRADYARGHYERSANDILESSRRDTVPESPDWFGQVTRAVSMSYIMTHWSDAAVPEPCDDSTPSDTAESADLQAVLRGMLDELPEQEQTLLRGIYFEGMSIKAAGERIGVGKAWASRLHARTLDTLALRLSDGDDS